MFPIATNPQVRRLSFDGRLQITEVMALWLRRYDSNLQLCGKKFEVLGGCFALTQSAVPTMNSRRSLLRQKCHQSATRTKRANEGLRALRVNLLIYKRILVALPGLEPGLFALRGRRVNQLHHNAMNGWGIRCDFVSIAKMG